MSEVGALKLLEAGALLLAGGAFVWWQLRDVKRAQERSRAERLAAERTAAQAGPADEKSPAP